MDNTKIVNTYRESHGDFSKLSWLDFEGMGFGRFTADTHLACLLVYQLKLVILYNSNLYLQCKVLSESRYSVVRKLGKQV